MWMACPQGDGHTSPKPSPVGHRLGNVSELCCCEPWSWSDPVVDEGISGRGQDCDRLLYRPPGPHNAPLDLQCLTGLGRVRVALAAAAERIEGDVGELLDHAFEPG